VKIPVLCGPTASGKTALSIQLALELAVASPLLEIISADAMMVYKGMDIGTAKPTPEERAAVPHHLIDLLEPNTDFSVAEWVRAAETAIADVLERGRIPFVVGGTGFYIRALSQGLPSTPPSDPEAIARLEVELKNQGLDAMIAELESASVEDATRAERNPRRVLRALEILRGTGQAPKDFAPIPPKYQFEKIALLPPRADLEKRIELRTKTMLEQGLIEETRALIPIFTRDGRRATSFQAIGYKQALDYLLGVVDDAGQRHEIALEEVERRINIATRQYAKRQETWFKAEPGATRASSIEEAKLHLEPMLKTQKARFE
jgi:tRNA dimethylallyltransferase